MNLPKNSIIGIACSQINANMQSHMRGYSIQIQKVIQKKKMLIKMNKHFLVFQAMY